MVLLDLGKVRTTAKDSVKGTILCPEKWCVGKITSILTCHAACFQFLFFFLVKYLYTYIRLPKSMETSCSKTCRNISFLVWMDDTKESCSIPGTGGIMAVLSIHVAGSNSLAWKKWSGAQVFGAKFWRSKHFLVGPTNPANLPGCVFVDVFLVMNCDTAHGRIPAIKWMISILLLQCFNASKHLKRDIRICLWTARAS